MKSPADKKSRSAPTRGDQRALVVGRDDQLVVSSEVFISDVKTPLSEEQYLERVEAILKVLGLPPLEEFNRMETEAEAKKKAAKRRS
jgi:hypothetical protein